MSRREEYQELRNVGWTIAQIAKACHVSYQTVHASLNYQPKHGKRGRKKIRPGDIKERTCYHCKRTLPANDFMLSKRYPGGVGYLCRRCNTLIMRKKQMVARMNVKGIEAFKESIVRMEEILVTAREVLREHESQK
jgi:hypothetical protein